MSTHEKNFPVTWEELHRNAKALAWRLNSNGPFKGVIAITRGGMVPAAVVARELEIRIIDTICIASYQGDKQEKLNVMKVGYRFKFQTEDKSLTDKEVDALMKVLTDNALSINGVNIEGL